MTWTDNITPALGVVSLCVFAGAGAFAGHVMIETIAEHADQIRAALWGNPVRDRYEDAVAAVDADLRMICSVRWPA